MSKKGLGRGIDALIPTAMGSAQEAPGEISIKEIKPNKYQPRRVFDDEAIDELSKSIRQHGVLQPILVRKVQGGYELVAGERRWRAAQMAGLSAIPAIVREYTDGEMTEIALIENIQRENLNSIEEALAYRQLMGEFGLTQDEVAKRVGRSRSMIANTVRLLNLAPSVQEHVSRGTISMGQAKPLLSLENHDLQVEAAQKIIEEDLSARDCEELVRRLLTAPRQQKVKKIEKKEIFLAEAEDKLKMLFGTKVKIKPGKLKSKIEIEFYSEDDLERIIEVLAEQRQIAAAKSQGTFIV